MNPTLPEEAVKAAQNAIRTTNWEYGITDADMAKALTAALPHLLGVGVKKLEWEYVERAVMTYVTSDDRGMLYYINQSFGSDSYYFATVRYSDGTVLYDGDDLPSAKAAAQADYEARILSALEPSSARELALEEAAKNCEREAAEVEGLIDDVAYHLRKRAAAIRALSSPDHADAGKVVGDGWLPIESAPKDGTPVLIAWQEVASVRGEKQWFQTVAHYDDSFEIAGYDEETGDAHKRGAWTDGAVASWAYEEIREISPTHWRPLPSAPSEGAE